MFRFLPSIGPIFTVVVRRSPTTIFTLVAVFLIVGWLPSYSSVQDSSSRPLPRSGASRTPRLSELHAIAFEGCSLTTPEQLIGVVESRESELSITRRFTRYLYDNLRRNPATPATVLQYLGRIQREVQNELRYYNAATVEADSTALLLWLNQNGFHSATVRTRFERDLDDGVNTLVFSINEGVRADVDTLAYLGLEDVPDDIRAIALQKNSVRSGDPFVESSIEESARAVVTSLRNNGYYRARTIGSPAVGQTDDLAGDTVVVVIEPGERVRVDSISFEENPNGYPSVHESTRRRQLEFSEGEWYSEEKIIRSRASLMSLTTFEIATIDSMPGRRTTDSTIHLRVFTKNIKPYDVGANLLLYQTSLDNFLNFGVGANAQYRNLFGGAQVASLTAQYVLQDVSRAFQGQQLETEAIGSFVFAWPSLARFGGVRMGLQSSVYYSRRTLINPFKIESFGITARTPFNLYSYTFFNSAELSLGLDRQVPRDYLSSLGDALQEANNAADSIAIVSTFNTFRALDDYLQNERGFFTGVFVGGTIRGEHRDNPVNPRRGTFTSFATEFGWGAGKFVRLQFFTTSASPIHDRLIFATKVNFGHIVLLDFSREGTANTYVPLERQFFAGGAASIRSYPSRRLHNPRSGRIDIDENLQPLLANILGSGSLMELSMELRYTFPRPRGLSDLWASLIERSGVTAFVDYGSAFNRLTRELYNTATVDDFINGSVLAGGIGYRFDTPVGPFRIDVATSLYDPSQDSPFIANRRNALGTANWQLSVGLGHAF